MKEEKRTMKTHQPKIKNVILAALFVILSFSIVVPCTAMEKATLRLGWLKDITKAGELVAKHQGFYKNKGIDLKILPGGFELDPVKLVAAGSDTFGIAGAESLLLARAKGIPLIAFGVQIQRTPVVFISRKEAEIVHPRDMVGKRVGVKFATDAETMYDILMHKFNINRKKITEIPLKWDMTPFLTGRVDVLPGYSVNEPRIARKKGLELNIMKMEDFDIKMYGAVYFTSEKIFTEKPDLVVNFLAAVVDGWWHAFRHKKTTLDIVMQMNTKLNREDQSEIYDLMLPLFVPENGRFGSMTAKGWKEAHDMLLEVGRIDKPLDIEKAYTTSVLETVYR